MIDQPELSGEEPMLGDGTEETLSMREPTLGTDDAVLHTIEMLEHENPSFRKRAVAKLAEIGTEQAQAALLDFMEIEKRSRSKRARIAQSLASIGSEQVIPDLAEIALRDEDKVVRDAASKAVAKIEPRQIVPSLIDALVSDAWKTRRNAAEALFYTGDARAVEPLISIMRRDRNWIVRLRATEALGEMRDARAYDPLVAVIQSADDTVRGAAMEALGKLGDERAISLLIEHILDDWWAPEAADSLGLIGRAGINAIIDLVGYQTEEIRILAIGALGSIADERVVSHVLSLLDDPNPNIRQAAIWRACMKIGKNELVEESLARVLAEDPQPTVRRAAAQTLREVGTNYSLEHLARALHDPDYEVKLAAAHTLGEKKLMGYEILRQELASEDWKVRRAAVAGLWSARDRRNSEVLIDALLDPHPTVQREAAFGLGVIGTPEALAAEEKWQRQQGTSGGGRY
jgi:HEAT repeat protein